MDILKRNNVHVVGQGDKTIVLAHGFGCDQQMWRYITPQLEKNYKLVLFDYVGSGKSQLEYYESEKYSSLEGYKQDLLDVIQTLDINKTIFIGHSVSSMIGMLASIERPELFESIIMIGPSPCYLNDGNYKGGFENSDIYELLDMMEMNFTGWTSYLAPLVSDTEQPNLTEELIETFRSNQPKFVREFAEVTFFSDYRQLLKQSEVPTLIIQCSNDSIVPIAVGEFLHDQLKNSIFEVIDARGHYPHISQPKETLQVIEKYLVEKI